MSVQLLPGAQLHEPASQAKPTLASGASLFAPPTAAMPGLVLPLHPTRRTLANPIAAVALRVMGPSLLAFTRRACLVQERR